MGGSIRPAKKEGRRPAFKGCQGADVGITRSAVVGKLLSAGLIRLALAPLLPHLASWAGFAGSYCQERNKKATVAASDFLKGLNLGI